MKNQHPCPHCGGADTRSDLKTADWNDEGLVVDSVCENCGSTWMDLYTLQDSGQIKVKDTCECGNCTKDIILNENNERDAYYHTDSRQDQITIQQF